MAKKLIRLYEQDTTDFSNNGLKILSPMSAKITRNLIEYTYQLELTHLLDEKGMMLTEERILGYNGQYFRISSIRRNLKEVSVIAKHIFFDLNKNFIEDINIKDKTGSMALSHILGGTSYPHSFSATSDIDTVASSRLVRKNVVSALIGDTDNSFINRWGGELDIDGFTFKLNEQIGKDDGYTIRYGKNLTGLDLQLNMLEVVTRIRPVGFDGIEIDGLYVDSPYIDNYALPIIKEIKYENVKWTGSPNYEEREDDDSYIYDNLAEAQAKLIELATNEFIVNEIDLPKTTINIEFIELSKTEEYKHLKFLQNINIGDTVHIYHKPLDINLKSRCIEYVYDCILNKYEAITLGSYTKNFFTKTQNTNNTLDNVSNTYETKADSISKIEGVNGSISALVGRVSSAESKITDEAITNTVKQSFYTKEETENQITSKGYQTSSQVQQTVDALQLKFTQSGGYNRIRNGIFKNGTSQWSSWGSPTISTKSDSGHSYGKSLVLTTTGTNQGVQQTVSDLCSGRTYTLSAYVYTWAANDCGIQIQCGGNYYASKVPTASVWQRISLTFKATSTSATVQIGRGGWGANGQHLFTAIQFEEGELATTYTPHPSEVYDGITTIDKDGINVATSYGAHTQFHSGGMSSYNNSNQRTLGIENGGISFHSWNNNALSAYITQSSLWGGDQSSNGLAISTTANGTYLALGTSSLSDVNTTLNMDQALTISASDGFQPRGINFWKDVHAHGYGIRQLSHLKLAGSGAIQFDYLNNSPSTIYEAVDNGHSLYVMGGYQMHLGVMEGSGTPHVVIWMRGKTDTHSYTHWDFHNYTMYNMKTASTYANYNTRRIGESYGVTSNVDGVRYVYRDVELVNGRAIRSIPLEYKGCEYDIVSIVCKGRGNAWVQDEDVDKFVIEGDCQSVNIEIIIHEIEQNLHTVALDEAYVEPLSQKIEPEIPTVITNVPPDTL